MSWVGLTFSVGGSLGTNQHTVDLSGWSHSCFYSLHISSTHQGTLVCITNMENINKTQCAQLITRPCQPEMLPRCGNSEMTNRGKPDIRQKQTCKFLKRSTTKCLWAIWGFRARIYGRIKSGK